MSEKGIAFGVNQKGINKYEKEHRPSPCCCCKKECGRPNVGCADWERWFKREWRLVRGMFIIDRTRKS